jgi:tetratricopeptide (TPR) repeat protein
MPKIEMAILLLGIVTLAAATRVFPQLPARAASRFERALELQQQGELKRAAEEYRSVLTIAPDYAEAHANLGVVLSRLGRYEEAISSYESALRINPGMAPIRLNLGIAHYRAKQFSRAVDALRQFLSSAPDSLQASELLGLALVEIERYEEALPHLESAIASDPDNPAVLYALGLAYIQQQRPEVDAVLTRLAAATSGSSLSRLLKGQYLLDKTEYSAAAIELEIAARLSHELPRLDYSLGLSYLMLGRYQEAAVLFERELSGAPQDFKTLYYLAVALQQVGDLAGARLRAESALKVEARSPEANVLLGRILLNQGRIAEALRPLEAAAAYDSANSKSHYILARAYQRAGHRSEAAREFAEAQRLGLQDLANDSIQLLRRKQ